MLIKLLFFRQRDELQGQREGPLRSGRRVPLWDAEGGAWSGSPGPGSQAEFLEESAPGAVPADGQQAGHEAFRQQEGADEGTDQAKGCRSLGHPSLLQFPVSLLYQMILALTGNGIDRRILAPWQLRASFSRE